jgi:hypothetical protein
LKINYLISAIFGNLFIFRHLRHLLYNIYVRRASAGSRDSTSVELVAMLHEMIVPQLSYLQRCLFVVKFINSRGATRYILYQGVAVEVVAPSVIYFAKNLITYYIPLTGKNRLVI